MMPSDETNRATRREWRELGFYYERDDTAKEWRLAGSRAGLLRFRDLLLAYVADPRNARQSEHEHYGPYMFLEVMTWPDAGADSHAIRGTLEDLKRLAILLGSKLENAVRGATIRIQSEYAQQCEYAIVLRVKDDAFDPPSEDPSLPKEAS